VGIWVHGVLISSVQWSALPCTNGVFGGRLENGVGCFYPRALLWICLDKL
jgi:hypothetical protein